MGDFWGSSSGKVFAVNAGAHGFGYLGAGESRERELHVFDVDSNAAAIAFRYTPQAPGSVWGWRHLEGLAPAIFVARDSMGSARMTWESESQIVDNPTPIVTLWRGREIIDAVTVVECIFPKQEVMAAIAALVGDSGAVTREWISMQSSRGMRVYPDLATMYVKEQSLTRINHAKLLYLRAASQDIYSHRGETCIPLIEGVLSIDADGVMTMA